MGERVKGARPIKRKPGFLYYIDAQGYPCQAKMKHAKKKKG